MIKSYEFLTHIFMFSWFSLASSGCFKHFKSRERRLLFVAMAASSPVESRKSRKMLREVIFISRFLNLWSSFLTLQWLEFQSFEWREKWDVDNCESYVLPEVFKNYVAVSKVNSFVDREGSPVIIIPFAGIDVWGLLHSATKTEIIKNTINILEGLFHLKHMIMINMNNLLQGLWDMDWNRARSMGRKPVNSPWFWHGQLHD